MADPITGAGIHNAIKAREVAGKTIIAALRWNRMTLNCFPIMKREFAGCPGRCLEGRWRKKKKMDA